ncbi:MAG: SelT/SelW/SelH family protein [Planctomycetes bacterium]|nr:SelT/SelW/SelH family protein [Planctomycetota bacterium]
MTEELLKAFKRDIQSLVLVPSDGGCFEVQKNGVLVFSKLKAARFPEEGEVRAILAGNRPPVAG